jgi:hypothetical protein
MRLAPRSSKPVPAGFARKHQGFGPQKRLAHRCKTAEAAGRAAQAGRLPLAIARRSYHQRAQEFVMLNDREKILSALREKPLKIYEVMKRANLPNEEACQSLLMKMRDEGLVKFDIHKGRWLIG